MPPSRPLTRAFVALVILALATLVGCTGLPGPPGGTTTTTIAPESCRGTTVAARKDVAYRRVTGVDPASLSLDAYVPGRPPGCEPGPIVVYVHGGGFVTGDKANQIDDKIRLFTNEGWTFVSVNYRLSSGSTAEDPAPVRYPVHEQDVAAAVAWVEAHAVELGGDPSRLFLVGHSSGAFLASLLSTDQSFLTAAGATTASVRCTVSLDTEYDVATQIAQGGAQERLYRNAFGDDPATWAKASPIEHTAIGASRPRFLVVTRGTPRRTTQARGFVDALDRGGTDASLLDVSPLTHEDVNDALGAADEQKVTPAVMAFLRSCL